MQPNREFIVIRGLSWVMFSDTVDHITWDAMYALGIREPRHQVPAHQYITLIGIHAVEMITGVVKTYYRTDNGEYIAFDCDVVLFVTNYPNPGE